MGGHGVSGRRRSHGHRHALQNGRATNRHRLQVLPQGTRLFTRSRWGITISSIDPSFVWMSSALRDWPWEYFDASFSFGLDFVLSLKVGRILEMCYDE